MQEIIARNKGAMVKWKPLADLMFAAIIYNVTGAHLALGAIIPPTADHTHAHG